jgi:hypothetical protein
VPTSPAAERLALGATPDISRAGLAVVVIVAAASIVAAAANATLILDDPYLVEHFRSTVSRNGVLKALWIFFFSLDLGAREYRLYGLSKIFHFGVWGLFGIHAAAYAAVIAVTQAATGLGIYRLLRRLHTDSWQAAALAWVWILSPFASTSCFHHYSYLILPYQLTVAGALALQEAHDAGDGPAWRWRLCAGAVGIAVACTGEAHLIAAILILVLVAVGTPSSRPRRQRWADASVPVTTIVATVVLHRWAWSALVTQEGVTPRYEFALPTVEQLDLRTATYLTSLPKGLITQAQAIVEFAGPWALLSAAVAAVIGLGLWKFWPYAEDTAPAPRSLPVALFCAGVASVAVVWGLSVFTGQVSVIFPRRYGYVPNTIAVMLVVALLAARPVRRRLGVVPALAVCVAVWGLWLTLQAACLPVVRAQDARVWSAARAAMADKQNPAILFLNAWNSPEMPGYHLHVETPGLRGREFPPIFESPFTAFWWQSQYAAVVLGARFVADRFTAQEGGRVRLVRGELNDERSIVVPIDSVVVMTDPGRVAPDWKADTSRVVVFSRWRDFLAAGHVYPVTLERGWDEPMNLVNTDGVAIALGQRGDRALPTGVLPDKRWSEPALPLGPIANHGLEAGEDGVFVPSPLGPLAYFRTNRHGAFTYRVDFVDRDSKVVALDVLELWHKRRGARLMVIDAAFDDRWLRIATIDPFAEAGLTPLAIKFPVSGVRSVRVRLSPAPGTTDIPFLNGIRVLRRAPGRP